ncbi:MAG TPA: DUF433 domain-containing protein [Acidimicrobiales bacterium]|nr:DUF433 domain-containing protein [Acidimicrobiales bacterium]
MRWERITVDPAVMGGQPCIRNLRVPVATVLTLLASEAPAKVAQELGLVPEDVQEALLYAADAATAIGRMDEVERRFWLDAPPHTDVTPYVRPPRYYLRSSEAEPWRQVTREEYVAAEWACGFSPQPGLGPEATAWFGVKRPGLEMHGRIDYEERDATEPG